MAEYRRTLLQKRLHDEIEQCSEIVALYLQPTPLACFLTLADLPTATATSELVQFCGKIKVISDWTLFKNKGYNSNLL